MVNDQSATIQTADPSAEISASSGALRVGSNDDGLAGRRPFDNWVGARELGLPMTAIGLAIGALCPLLQAGAMLVTVLATIAVSVTVAPPDGEYPMLHTTEVVSTVVLPVVILAMLFVVVILACGLGDRLARVSGPPLLALWARTGVAVFVGAALIVSMPPAYVAMTSTVEAPEFLLALARSFVPLVPFGLLTVFVGVPITGVLRYRRGYPSRRDYLPAEPSSSAPASRAERFAA